MTTDQSRILVLYHYPCPDGGFAALAAALHFQQIGQERVLFVPNRVYDPCTVSKLDLQVSWHRSALPILQPGRLSPSDC